MDNERTRDWRNIFSKYLLLKEVNQQVVVRSLVFVGCQLKVNVHDLDDENGDEDAGEKSEQHKMLLDLLN